MIRMVVAGSFLALFLCVGCNSKQVQEGKDTAAANIATGTTALQGEAAGALKRGK